MADDYYDPKLAYNKETGGTVPAWAQGLVYAFEDTSFTTPLAITDESGLPIPYLVASENGIYPGFIVPSGQQRVRVKAGEFVTPMTSDKGRQGDPGADGTPGVGVPLLSTGAPGQVVTHDGTAAKWAPPPVAGSGISGAPTVWPSLFPPVQHSHTATQISDASTVGRGVLTAADQQSARAAIGAGTGNGTSDVKIGTGASDAAAGNHGHTASSIAVTPSGAITATNVQDALVQAAASGGGGTGTSEIRVLRFASGQYPAFPALKPAGVTMFTLIGPSSPTTANVSGGIPAYVGNGSTQIPAEWRMNSGLT